MTQLQKVNLANNRLSGILPAAWGNMTQLQEVNLADNRLSGGLPAAWGAITNLSRLELTNNSLTELPHRWDNIPSDIYSSFFWASNNFNGIIPER